ncbi:MAG TPA: DNA polymerase IV [Candidatus Omnitrophota bacterium]|nr:DNA polymerase IV [Candidatus Omnitrophota bacterium]
MPPIIHIDMDAFYAAVEQRDNPELRGKPVIVGGSPTGRGVVSTASYEARKFGVHSAMPAGQAKKLCPQGIFLKPNFEKYETASRQIHSIFRQYTDIVEPVSLDEAYLDVSKNKLNLDDPVMIARLIKQSIRAVTRLTASAGVAPNKFLAKIASDMKKPDGLFVVTPDEVENFLEPLPVRKIPGVGPVTEKKLTRLGIETCGTLLSKSKEELRKHFGKFGIDLWEMARGIDASPVIVGWKAKQIGCEETFEKDLLSLEDLKRELKLLAAETLSRAREDKKSGRTLTLKVKYADFTVITRSETVTHPLEDTEEIAARAFSLLRKKTEAGRRKIRLLGISLSGFAGEKKRGNFQPELFSF